MLLTLTDLVSACLPGTGVAKSLYACSLRPGDNALSNRSCHHGSQQSGSASMVRIARRGRPSGRAKVAPCCRQFAHCWTEPIRFLTQSIRAISTKDSVQLHRVRMARCQNGQRKLLVAARGRNLARSTLTTARSRPSPDLGCPLGSCTTSLPDTSAHGTAQLA